MTNIAEAYHIVYDTQGVSAKEVSAFLEAYFHTDKHIDMSIKDIDNALDMIEYREPRLFDLDNDDAYIEAGKYTKPVYCKKNQDDIECLEPITNTISFKNPISASLFRKGYCVDTKESALAQQHQSNRLFHYNMFTQKLLANVPYIPDEYQCLNEKERDNGLLTRLSELLKGGHTTNLMITGQIAYILAKTKQIGTQDIKLLRCYGYSCICCIYYAKTMFGRRYFLLCRDKLYVYSSLSFDLTMMLEKIIETLAESVLQNYAIHATSCVLNKKAFLVNEKGEYFLASYPNLRLDLLTCYVDRITSIEKPDCIYSERALMSFDLSQSPFSIVFTTDASSQKLTFLNQ